VDEFFACRAAHIFGEVVNRVFGDLATQGFQVLPVSNTTAKLIGETLVSSVVNAKLGRGIRLTLLHAVSGTEALSSFLYRPEGVGGFALGDFLKHIKAPAQTIRALDLAAQPGDLSQRLEASLNVMRTVVDQHLLAALLGGQWPSVPVDWGDYK